MAEKRTKSDGFMLRFPDGMRDRLKELASLSGRSLNAEIIDRLEKSIKWPQVSLPDGLEYGAIQNLPARKLAYLEAEFESFIISKTVKALQDHKLSQLNLVSRFEEVVNYAPEEERPRLRQELRELLERVGIKPVDEDDGR